MENLVCEVCNRAYIYKRANGSTTKICGSCHKINRRRQKKLRAIELKGGKCEVCGYNKCPRALVFHHKDPSQKEFEICSDFDRRWDAIVNELQKCVMLCANCHAEEHNK